MKNNPPINFRETKNDLGKKQHHRNAKCITWKEHIGNHNNVNSQYS